MPQQTIARIGDYMIDSRLGSGGMGMVYKAKQISMHRFVALKVLRENLSTDRVYLERFFHEVRVMAAMEHPNMVRVYEGGMDKNMAYFSMEYIEGLDLKRLLDCRYVFPELEVIDVALQVASALSYAWQKDRLVHRDVKPANIMRLKDGTVKILDLGISKKLSASSGQDVFVTNTGVMVGSPSYMSPEQARSNTDIDFRADIYSLGISLYQLLAGVPPYDGKSAVEVVTQHFSAPVPDVRSVRADVSGRFAQLIKKMMAKEREDRFGSWDELREKLIAIRENAVKREKRKSDVEFQTALRSILLKAVTVAGICLAIIVALHFLLPKKQQTPEKILPETTAMAALPDTEEETIEDLRKEYEKQRKRAIELFEKKCRTYWEEKDYAAGIRYCQEQPLDADFRENGKFYDFYREDSSFQNRIKDELKLFQQEFDKRDLGFQ